MGQRNSLETDVENHIKQLWQSDNMKQNRQTNLHETKNVERFSKMFYEKE